MTNDFGDDDLAALLQGGKTGDMLALVRLMSQIGAPAGAGGASLSPAAGLLGEQRARAELQANALDESAQYVPLFNPGGLFDVIGSFIGSLGLEGVSAPQLEPGARIAQHIPLESSIAGMLAETGGLQATGGGAGANAYDEQIKAILGEAFNQLMGTKEAAVTGGAIPAEQSAAAKSIRSVSGLEPGVPQSAMSPKEAFEAFGPPAGLPDWVNKLLEKSKKRQPVGKLQPGSI